MALYREPTLLNKSACYQVTMQFLPFTHTLSTFPSPYHTPSNCFPPHPNLHTHTHTISRYHFLLNPSINSRRHLLSLFLTNSLPSSLPLPTLSPCFSSSLLCLFPFSSFYHAHILSPSLIPSIFHPPNRATAVVLLLTSSVTRRETQSHTGPLAFWKNLIERSLKVL